MFFYYSITIFNQSKSLIVMLLNNILKIILKCYKIIEKFNIVIKMVLNSLLVLKKKRVIQLHLPLKICHLNDNLKHTKTSLMQNIFYTILSKLYILQVIFRASIDCSGVVKEDLENCMQLEFTPHPIHI